MSTEVFSPAPHETSLDVFDLSPEELREELDGILHATTETEARAHELSYGEITQLFLEAHNAKVEQLHQQKREMILETLLNNPTEAFQAEFLQLKLLYKDRTLGDDRWDGTKINEFCTQNHKRGTCDYLFQHRVLPSGDEVFEVRKVYQIFGRPDLISISLRDGELSVQAQTYERSRTGYRELEGEARDRVMAQFFYDTIHASAEQFNRSADEREENDIRARGYLSTLRKNDHVLF